MGSQICSPVIDRLGHRFGDIHLSDHSRAHLGDVHHHYPAPSSAPRKPRLIIPFCRDRNFVGREDVLNDLDSRLNVSGYHNRVALTGLGGVGKSQIAIEYSHLYSQKHSDHWVFWVYAASKERFAQSYSKIAVQIGLLRPGDSSSSAIEAVSDWLSDPDNGSWLMVVDNADDNDVLFQANDGQRPLVEAIPQCSHGAVLITSRTQTGVDVAESEIHVRSFDERTSLQLLSKKLGRRLDDDDEAKQLASELEHIALALTQAAHYIRFTKQSIAYYLELFRQEERKQVELLGKEWRDLRRDTSVSNAVLTSWRITWDQLRKECYLAAQLLARMSLLDRQRIPRFLVLNFKNRKDELPDQRRLEAMGMLQQYGLCWASGETTDSGYSMHRLVQVCTKAWLREAGKLPAWERHVVANVGRYASDGWLWNALVPHAQAILPYMMASGKVRHQPAIYSVLLRAATLDQRLDRQIELLDQTIDFFRSRSIGLHSMVCELMISRSGLRMQYDPSSVTLAHLEKLRVDCLHSGYLGYMRIVLEILIIEKRFPEDRDAIAAVETLLEDVRDEPPTKTTHAKVVLLVGRLFWRCAVARQFDRARRALSSARKIADRIPEPDPECEETLRGYEVQLLGICGERHDEAALLSYMHFQGGKFDISGSDSTRTIYLVVFYIRGGQYIKAEAVFNTIAGLFGKIRPGVETALPSLALRLTHEIATNPRAYLQKIWDRWGMALGVKGFEELWHAFVNGVVHGVDWKSDFWLHYLCPRKPSPLGGSVI